MSVVEASLRLRSVPPWATWRHFGFPLCLVTSSEFLQRIFGALSREAAAANRLVGERRAVVEERWWAREPENRSAARGTTRASRTYPNTQVRATLFVKMTTTLVEEDERVLWKVSAAAINNHNSAWAVICALLRFSCWNFLYFSIVASNYKIHIKCCKNTSKTRPLLKKKTREAWFRQLPLPELLSVKGRNRHQIDAFSSIFPVKEFPIPISLLGEF